MKQRVVYLAISLLATSSLTAQEAKKWTLNDCIEYALEKNIQLQQDKISLEESDVDVKTAKATLFPSLSFNTGHNVTNRPYQENSSTVNGTEIISSNSKTTYSGNYGLNAQWTVWNGNKRINTDEPRNSGTYRSTNGKFIARTNRTSVYPNPVCR